MADNTCRVLWTGDSEHHEFVEVLTWLDRHTALTRKPAPPARGDFQADPAGAPFDLILVGQARPGQYCQEYIERWFAVAPLTPILAVLGSWCEGEMRSGRPWKGIPRVYWHQILPSLARELKAFTPCSAPTNGPSGLRGASWRMPRTVTDVERYLHAARQPLFPHQPVCSEPFALGGSIPAETRPSPDFWLIRSETRVTFETLANALRLARRESVWWPARSTRPLLHGMQGILWDAEQLDDVEWRQLEHHAETFRRHYTLVTASFLRQEEKTRLSRYGVAQVLSKPFQLEWLLREIAETNLKA